MSYIGKKVRKVTRPLPVPAIVPQPGIKVPNWPQAVPIPVQFPQTIPASQPAQPAQPGGNYYG